METGDFVLLGLLGGVGLWAVLKLNQPPPPAPTAVQPPCTVGGSYKGIGANVSCSALDKYIGGALKKGEEVGRGSATFVAEGVGYLTAGVKRGITTGGVAADAVTDTVRNVVSTPVRAVNSVGGALRSVF